MRFLVVDDEYIALTKVVTILSQFGSCDAATSGDQAYTMFSMAIDEGRPYNLMTIDIQMPGMNGLEFMKKVRKLEEKVLTLPSRKIFITAAGYSTNVISAKKYQCDAFLIKPVKKRLLLSKLIEFGIIDRKLTDTISNENMS